MIFKLKLTNFRKFKHLELDLKNKVLIITGHNAIGKTSILESIYLVGTSKSHRTNDVENLINNEEDYLKIELESEKKYEVIISKEGKTNFINDVKYSKISDFIGNLNVIMFSPLDIDLINGSKSVRRRFLDLEVSLLDKSYLRATIAYKKLLKERNELLKNFNEDSKLMLKVLNEQIFELIKSINSKRNVFINSLNSHLKNVCDKLKIENIQLEYEATYDINDLNRSFNNKLNYDILTKTTNIGPHRDDFKINLNNLDAKEYASEGQSRSTVLAIKLALKEIYKKENKEIILLLDDIFASIDQKRINSIMEYIKDEHQTFITTTSILNIPDELLSNAKIIRL